MDRLEKTNNASLALLENALKGVLALEQSEAKKTYNALMKGICKAEAQRTVPRGTEEQIRKIFQRLYKEAKEKDTMKTQMKTGWTYGQEISHFGRSYLIQDKEAGIDALCLKCQVEELAQKWPIPLLDNRPGPKFACPDFRSGVDAEEFWNFVQSEISKNHEAAPRSNRGSGLYRELTENYLADPVSAKWSSADVREGICRLEDCHRSVRGTEYTPEEVFNDLLSPYNGVHGTFPQAHYYSLRGKEFSGKALKSHFNEWLATGAAEPKWEPHPTVMGVWVRPHLPNGWQYDLPHERIDDFLQWMLEKI